jgi:hypothetical protein
MFLFLLPLLFACGTMSLKGDVVDGSGQPVAGVTVQAKDTECSTTTDAMGRFVLECDPGSFVLTFSKAEHIGEQTSVDAPEKMAYPVPTQTLIHIPKETGLYVLNNGQYLAVETGLLERTMRSKGDTLKRAYCLQGGSQQPTKLKQGEIALFDYQATSWRLFRLDADRCAYRDTRNALGRWVVSYRDKPTIKTKTLGEQLVVHRAQLKPGHYFAAHWKGFFSPTDSDVSLYGGHWIQVED